MESQKIYRVTVLGEPGFRTEFDIRSGSLPMATSIFEREVCQAISDHSASVLLSLVTGESTTTLAAKCSGCAYVEVYRKYYELLETSEFVDGEKLY